MPARINVADIPADVVLDEQDVNLVRAYVEARRAWIAAVDTFELPLGDARRSTLAEVERLQAIYDGLHPSVALVAVRAAGLWHEL